jgi:hypothetical protein
MATRKTTSSKKPTSPARAKTTAPAVSAGTAAAATASDAVATDVTLSGDAPAPVRQAIKKKELFARVKARAGKVKGPDVRVVMDAVLEELGALLVEGETLAAQPLGTLKVQRHRALAGADVVVCKLRRKKPGGGEKDPLAEAAE